MKTKTPLVFFMLFLIALGCQKYPNGGMSRFAKSRIMGTWKLEEYFLNNFEFTQDLSVVNLKETFNDGGTFNRTFIDNNASVRTHEGGWDLIGDKTVLKISTDSTYAITATATVLTSNFTIQKLTKDQLWYTFTAGNGTHELHFTKQ